MFGIAALALSIVDTPIIASGSTQNLPSGTYNGTLYFDQLEDLATTKYFVECETTGSMLNLRFIRHGDVGIKLFYQCAISGPPRKCSGVMEFV